MICITETIQHLSIDRYKFDFLSIGMLLFDMYTRKQHDRNIIITNRIPTNVCSISSHIIFSTYLTCC